MQEPEIKPLSTDDEVKQFLLFELDKEFYAVPVAEVSQVIKIPPITSVPNAPEGVVGIFHLRGKVIVAIDLEKRLHLARERPFNPSYLFVAHRDNNDYGILIDRPSSVVRIKSSEVVAVDPLTSAHIPAAYLQGVFMHDVSRKEKKKAEPSFMILPPGTPPPEEPIKEAPRPVLILSLAQVLNQDELRGIPAPVTPI
jgi:purine-binding chemotaxis protein CheW